MRVRLAVYALVFVLGAGAAALVTSPGMVVTPDGGQYLAAASNIASGRGVTSPIVPETTDVGLRDQLLARGRMPFTEWPPVYPTAVAAVSQLGMSPVGAARLLNVLAVGATAALVVALVELLAGSLAGGVAVAVAVMAGPVVAGYTPLQSVNVLDQSVFVLSESLFLPLVLGALLAGGSSLAGGRRRFRLALVLVVVATLVRFVGLAAGAALAVAVILAPSTRGRRARPAVAALLSGPVAVLAWMLVRKLLWGAGPTKALGWHPPGTRRAGGLVDVTAGWFGMQPGVADWLRVLVVVAVAVAATAVVVAPRARRAVLGPRLDEPARLGVAVAMAAFVWVYPAVVLASVVLVDVNVPLDQRVLGPAGVVLVVLLGALVVAAVANRWPAQAAWLPAGVAATLALVVALAGTSGLADVHRAHTAAVDNALRRAAQSPVGKLPAADVVFSNRPGDLYADIGRPSLLLPPMVDLSTGRRNGSFRRELGVVTGLLSQNPGVVVVFRDLAPGAPDLSAALGRAGLVEVGTCADDLRAFTDGRWVDRVAAAQPC